MNYHLKSLFVLFAGFLCFAACQTKNAVKDFERNGISFNLPKNWKISVVDSADADYCSISLDPKSEDGTSFIFIEWGTGLFELDKQIRHVQSGYLEHPDMQKGGIEFSEVNQIEFAKQKAVHSSFKLNITGIEQEGNLYCFQFPECNRTLSIVVQNAAVDKSAIAAVLKELEKSMACKKPN